MPETSRLEDTLVRGYRQLALETPERPRDAVLRALDIVFSAFFLIVSLPISLLLALVVVVTSGTPVLYRGERVGRGGHVFTMFKFRTLERGAEHRLGTHLGEELVQATQLDEIPQFINVLRGDMSLVGPRPIRPVFFEELAHDLEWIADRSVRLYLRTVIATGWRVLRQSVGGIFRPRT